MGPDGPQLDGSCDIVNALIRGASVLDIQCLSILDLIMGSCVFSSSGLPGCWCVYVFDMSCCCSGNLCGSYSSCASV